MQDLNDFYCKEVKLIDVDGKKWFGSVEDYSTAYDNNYIEDSISLKIKEKPNVLIEFCRSEIKEIIFQ